MRGDPVHASLHVDRFVDLARLVGWALLCHARERISSLLSASPAGRDTLLSRRDPVPAADPKLWN
jgi:hypothetical protein